MTAHPRLFQAFESLPIHGAVTAIAVFAVVFLFRAYAVAQDYPPYGPNLPTAHFDHGNRGHAIPPPPKLKCPVLSPSCKDTRTAQSEWNTELLGSDTLDGRSTYQPLVVHQGDRYIAYMGHHAGCAINRLNGQNELNGTSILDVTDPQHPIYLHHIIGAGTTCAGGGGDAGGNQMVRVCGGDMLPSNSKAEADRKHGHYYMLRSNGAISHQVFDVTDPSNPTLLATIAPGLTATHKNYWECYTGLAYLVANDSAASSGRTDATGKPDSAPGWLTNQHIKIYNLHDPARFEYIRDFGLVGQQPGGTTVEGLVSPPPGIHGPIAAGNRIFAPYGVGNNGVVQILDSKKVLNGCTKLSASLHCATNPTQAEMLDPQLGWLTLPGTSLQGGHTSFPIFGEQDGKPRNLVLVVSEEGGNECGANSAPHAGWLYDITDEAKPKLIGEDPSDPARTKIDVPNGFDYTWVGIEAGHGTLTDFSGAHHCGITNTADCPKWGVYGASVTPQDPPQPNNNPNSFCNQGARFGAHSSAELFYPPYYGRLAIHSWFTGGLRVFDIRNPDDPRPIAYFIPEPNDTGCGSQGGPSPGPGCTFANTGRDGHTVKAIHTNNAEVDARGLIYTADRAGTGMHIIKLTGQAAAAARGGGNDNSQGNDNTQGNQ